MRFPVRKPADRLGQLEAVIDARLADGDPATSYVAKLAAQGTRRIAQKVGEEATETVIAAVAGDKETLVDEAADLIFHLMVLLRKRGVGWDEVVRELGRREAESGLTEAASRG